MAISWELQVQVWARDNGRCRYCLLSQIGQASRFHVDHVVPRKLRGETKLLNLALLCPHCNLHKATRVVGTNPLDGKEVPLFTPLEQNWNEHFVLLADGQCLGISSVGRATVAALSMNHPYAVMARKFQIQLGVISATQHIRN